MINYPESLDSFTIKTNDITDVNANDINDLQDAVVALQSKVGANASITPTSHEYKIRLLENSGIKSINGLNTDNSDPVNPVVKISIDSNSLSGLGTPASPLKVVGGEGNGDMLKNVYDPANGNKQVAFEDEVIASPTLGDDGDVLELESGLPVWKAPSAPAGGADIIEVQMFS